MRPASRWALLACSIAGLALHGCQPCERSGCEAVERPGTSSQISRGLVGSVALESDASNNSCFECRFASAQLTVWSTPAPVADVEGARAVVNGGGQTFTIMAEQRYEKALEPGHYLVCKLPSTCAAISIPASGLATVNVKQVFGPSSMVVFEPGSNVARADKVFVISTQR